jgi:hypothetical protein
MSERPSIAPRTLPSTASLLASKVTVPQHVVYRSFPTETVMLNLQTGRYHGLNATADAMLKALEASATVREAAVALAGSFGQPQEVIEGDLCALCTSLLERDLIETDASPES